MRGLSGSPHEEDHHVTITDADAFKAMLAHHRTLEDQVTQRVVALRESVAKNGPHEAAQSELVAYLAKEVLPHAIAEEHSIYEAARSLPDLASTVEVMIAEHRELATSVEALATSQSPADVTNHAASIERLFSTHVAKENDLLLPALQSNDTVSLSDLLVQMHLLTDAAQHESSTAGDVSTPDTDTTLVGLLMEASNLLAEAGHSDRACRLAAQTWATIRIPRPDLAERVTAALHRLVRPVSNEPIAFSTPKKTGESTASMLDVRKLAPAHRHDSIFAAYDALVPGDGFVLINDHNPKPLRYQFEAEHAGKYTWDYLEQGPHVWRVRIGRPVTPHA